MNTENALALFSSHPILISYLLGLNFVAFFIYGLDKFFATSGAHRVRERTLFLLALFGGTAGALLGMKFFRHKTRKNNFLIVIALIVLVQIVLLFWLLPKISLPDYQSSNF